MAKSFKSKLSDSVQHQIRRVEQKINVETNPAVKRAFENVLDNLKEMKKEIKMTDKNDIDKLFDIKMDYSDNAAYSSNRKKVVEWQRRKIASESPDEDIYFSDDLGIQGDIMDLLSDFHSLDEVYIGSSAQAEDRNKAMGIIEKAKFIRNNYSLSPDQEANLANIDNLLSHRLDEHGGSWTHAKPWDYAKGKMIKPSGGFSQYK